MTEAPPMESRITRGNAMKALSKADRNSLIQEGSNVIDGRKFFEHRATQARLAREYRKPITPEGSTVA